MCSMLPEQERIVKQIMEPPLSEWRRLMREARERSGLDIELEEALQQHMSADQRALKRLIDGYSPRDNEDDDIDLNSDDKIYAR
jgi:hypothetical protein